MTGFDLSTISDCYIGSTQVSEIYYGATKIWPTAVDYSREYLTLVPLEAGTFTWTDTNNSRSISYSTDDGSTWTTLTSGSTTPTIAANSKVLLKANLGAGNIYGNGTISSSGRFNAMGNIMSLVGRDNFNNLTTISNDYQFAALFENCNKLIDTSNLILPATTLATRCYYYMFYRCISLTTAPALPATTLAEGCYQRMFCRCISLTTAPALPATTLRSDCYDWMFYGCLSLITAPELPATTLANDCYLGMFCRCESLTIAPALPATTLAGACYGSMFQGCTSLTTAPALPATTLTNNCYAGMFYGCSSLTTAPQLPATTLVYYCYSEMFYGCTSLNEVHCDATDISATDCLDNWLNGVSQTGDFYKPSTTTYPTGASGIPSGWTVHSTGHDYSQDYLTFQILENGVIPWKQNTTAKIIEYSLNNGSWTSITSTSAGIMINVSQGDTIRFRGNNATYCNNNKSYYSGFGLGEGTESYVTDAASFNVEGNIMSLIYGDNFVNQTTFNGETYVLCSLFKKAKVVSAENLILPATTLTDYCYRAMFSKCTYLETAPQLPATTLAKGVYYYMFEKTAITEAPDLLAETLVSECYQSMFTGCSSLNYIKCLATNLNGNTSSNWVKNVAASGTFVKSPYMTSWLTGASGIPSGWTIHSTDHGYSLDYLTLEALEAGTFTWTDTVNSRSISYSTDNGSTWITLTAGSTTPSIAANSKVLLKATLGAGKFNSNGTISSSGRFNVMGNIMSICKGSNFINQTTISNAYQFASLFTNCTKLIDASNLILPATTLEISCYSYMFAGCSSLTTAPQLPATTLTNNCYYNMFNGCTSLTTAPTLPATTLTNNCYAGMFYGCSSLTTAPQLPATTLTTGCYNVMFNGCTRLNYIKCLATNISATNCTQNWTGNVAASGTFIKDSSMTSWTTGNNGIPSGWTVTDNTSS